MSSLCRSCVIYWSFMLHLEWHHGAKSFTLSLLSSRIKWSSIIERGRLVGCLWFIIVMFWHIFIKFCLRKQIITFFPAFCRTNELQICNNYAGVLVLISGFCMWDAYTLQWYNNNTFKLDMCFDFSSWFVLGLFYYSARQIIFYFIVLMKSCSMGGKKRVVFLPRHWKRTYFRAVSPIHWWRETGIFLSKVIMLSESYTGSCLVHIAGGLCMARSARVSWSHDVCPGHLVTVWDVDSDFLSLCGGESERAWEWRNAICDMLG